MVRTLLLAATVAPIASFGSARAQPAPTSAGAPLVLPEVALPPVMLPEPTLSTQVPILAPVFPADAPPAEPISPPKTAPAPAQTAPATPTPGACPATPAPAPADPLTALEQKVEALSKNLTIVTGDEQIKIVLGGIINADFYYNHARPVAAGIPFFLTPRSPFGFNQDTFDANARATTLFAAVNGPKIGDFESGGLIAVCFFNDALIVDRYGLLPLQAYAQLKNDDWRIAAGLQFDVFNPLNPSTLTFAYLAGSGNAGVGFPGQFRVERYFHPNANSQVTLTAALSEPISTTVNNSLQISEDNGWPDIEARAALALGPLQGEGPLAKRPFEVGVSGLIGQIRTTAVTAGKRIVADVAGFGSDFRWAITPSFGVQGEAFVGQTLGNYTAGILQDVNLVTFQPIRTSGGWIEAYYYLCPEKLHTHVGYGIDDPLDRDLAPGQPVRNETYFANLIWDVTKHLRLGWELTYRRTEYTILRNDDGLGFQTQVQLKF